MSDAFILEAVERVAMHIAEIEGEVTADDVRAAMPNAPFKRSTFGAAFLALQESGRLVAVRYVPSKHPANHGRRIAVYQVKQ